MNGELYAFTRIGFRAFECTGAAALIVASHILFLTHRSATA